MAAIMQLLANIGLFTSDGAEVLTQFNENKLHFAPEPPDERSNPIQFERGDRVFVVESNPKGWREQ